MYKYIILTYLASLCTSVFGQLSIAEAQSILLANNKNITSLDNAIARAEINTRKYNRGYMPTLTLNGGLETSASAIFLNFNNGVNVSRFPNTGYNGTVGGNFNYALHSPARDITNKLNDAQLDNAKLQKEQTVDDLVFALHNTYYTIARLEKNRDVLTSALIVSNERLTRIRQQYNYGQATQIDVLNAEVDRNRDSLSIITFEQQIMDLKRDVNLLLFRDADIPFDITLDGSNPLKYEDLMTTDRQDIDQNARLQTTAYQVELDKIRLDLANASQKPTLSLFVNYNGIISGSAANANNLSRLINTGLTAGLNLNWNILDGGIRKTQTALAQIDIENSQNTTSIVKAEVENNLHRIIANHRLNLQIADNEKNNMEINQYNFDRTLSAYRSGTASALDFRQAQLNLLNAELNYHNAIYNAKLNEIELDFILGRL